MTTVLKRPVPHDHPKQNEIYVSHSSSFPALINRINTLLFETGFDRVVLYGTGASIIKSMQLAVAIQKQDKRIKIIVNTDTVEVIDDITNTEVSGILPTKF